jgi:hypothetical protein
MVESMLGYSISPPEQANIALKTTIINESKPIFKP